MNHYFSEYIDALEHAGELVRITRRVDPVLEMAEITDRQASTPHGGKAVLFENTETGIPVVTNLFSSENRIAMAFDVDKIKDASTRLAAFLQAMLPARNYRRFMNIAPSSKLSPYTPRTADSGACQEIALFPPDLNRIPFFQNRPFDEAQSMGSVTVLMKNPYVNGNYYIENARVLWHSKTTVQIRFEPSSLASVFLNASPSGRVPMALLFGGDPLYHILSFIPMVSDIDPMFMLGYLRKKNIIKVPCLSQPLEVPDNCDMVVEGYLDKNAASVPSIACGEDTGFYSSGEKEPLMFVTCITRRKNAVISINIPALGLIRSQRYITKAYSVFLENFIEKNIALEVRSICFPHFSHHGNAAVVAIDKHFQGQTHKIAHAIWGSTLTTLNKLLIVVDVAVDVENWNEVNACIANYYNPVTDTFFSRGPLSLTDHAAPVLGFGGKICIDATRKTSSPAKPCHGALSFCFYHEKQEDPIANDPKSLIYIKLNNEVDLSDHSMCLWQAINQTDPIRDIHLSDGKLFVDACIKRPGDRGVTRPWPNVSCSSLETIKTVDACWDKLKIGKKIPSPSLKFHPLLRDGKAIISE